MLFFKVIEAIWPSLTFLQGKGQLVEFDLFSRKGRRESGLLWPLLFLFFLVCNFPFRSTQVTAG